MMCEQGIFAKENENEISTLISGAVSFDFRALFVFGFLLLGES